MSARAILHICIYHSNMYFFIHWSVICYFRIITALVLLKLSYICSTWPRYIILCDAFHFRIFFIYQIHDHAIENVTFKDVFGSENQKIIYFYQHLITLYYLHRSCCLKSTPYVASIWRCWHTILIISDNDKIFV